MSSVAENKKVVQQFMEDFSVGDVDRTLSHLDESATWWVLGTVDGISGIKSKEEFRKSTTGLSNSIETGSIELIAKEWTAEGDRVAVEAESFSTLIGGRKYNNVYHFAFIVRNGKITSVKVYMDTEHARSVFRSASAS